MSDLVFDTLWARVLEAWDDDKAHAALLDYALRNEKLPEAAGAYRALLEDPEKGERAKKKLDALVAAATQMMMAMKSPAPPRAPAWINLIALIACFALVAAMGWAILARRP